MNDSNYGLFSPVPKFGFPDYKRGSGQWYDWLDEQIHYIINGYEVGGDKITGRLYYKLNWTKMLITDAAGNKRPMYPYYADGIREFYDTIEYCFDKEKNFLYGKGRDKGFTYDIAALSLYQMQFVEYSNVLAVFPGGQSPARNNFQNAYQLAFDELDPDMKCYPDLSDNKEVLMYGWEETDTETKVTERDGLFTKLTMKLATDADVGKSGRYKMVIIEEFGEIDNPKDLIATSDANMREGSKKFGIVIAGGTSNAMKISGYKDFRDIWHNPEQLGFVKLFCPAQKMYWGFVNPVTGKSDTDGAKKHRTDTVRSKLKENSREMMIEKQNYPFDEEEMFIAISKSPFSSQLASQQISHILSDKSITSSLQRGNLYERKGEDGKMKVEFHRNEIDGRWLVFKGPMTGTPLNPDVGAVDSYRFGDIEAPDSKGAIIGYRPWQGMNLSGNLPIFIYLHRWDDKERFFEDCLLSAKYWNMKLLIEKTDEDIFTYFRQHMATRWLKEKPKLIQNPYTKPTVDYGVPPGGGNKEKALEYAVQEFNQHVGNIPFIELLDELINFGSKNTDLAMAYIWAVLHSFDSIRVLEEHRNKPKRERPFRPYAISGGNGKVIMINSPAKEKMYG